MNDDLIVTTDSAGQALRHELGGPVAAAPRAAALTPARAPAGETAIAAAASQAQALVQARYAMAYARPRDWDTVRADLLSDCDRPGFARVARYHKPIGRGVEGPSIRFAEAAMRRMTNVLAESATIYDDVTKRIIRVSATDLEANISHFKDVVIEKVVERSSLRPGQSAVEPPRLNAQGHLTFLVRATEDDLLNKEAALASKALRGLALRLLPGDILDEAMERVQTTLSNDAARDPDAERKRLLDAFGSLGVKPADLKTYLGHDISQLVPAQLVELRAVYAAIKDGEATWSEAMEHKARSKPARHDDAPKSLDDLTKRKSEVQP